MSRNASYVSFHRMDRQELSKQINFTHRCQKHCAKNGWQITTPLCLIVAFFAVFLFLSCLKGFTMLSVRGLGRFVFGTLTKPTPIFRSSMLVSKRGIMFYQPADDEMYGGSEEDLEEEWNEFLSNCDAMGAENYPRFRLVLSCLFLYVTRMFSCHRCRSV